MGRIQLRDYQQGGVQGIRRSFAAKNRAVLFVLPTGGGKTYTFCYIAQGGQQKGRRILILVHRKELLLQASMSLAALGIRHCLIAQNGHIREAMNQHMKELRYSAVDQSSSVAVASVDTLKNRLTKVNKPDLIICDEAHHCIKDNKWGRIVEHYGDSRLLGVTATPCRTDGTGLGVHAGGVFNDMVQGPSINTLIEQGHLLRPSVFAPPTPLDLKGVRRTAKGDYSQSQLADRVDQSVITGSAVDHYMEYGKNLPFIGFCVSIDHAEHVASEFRSRGKRVESIDGSMHDAQRRGLIQGLAAGKLDGLTSCDLISEGTDIPVVGCGIMLRPTESEALFLQQAGRILRPYDGQDEAILLDHVGNVGRIEDGQFIPKHGMPDAEREWSLDGREKGAKRDAAEAATRVIQCDVCYATFYPAPTCRHCGAPVESKGRELKQVEGQLMKLSAEEVAYQKRAAQIEQATTETYEDLVKLGLSRGYKNPKAWARHVYNNRKKEAAKKRLNGGDEWAQKQASLEIY